MSCEYCPHCNGIRNVILDHDIGQPLGKTGELTSRTVGALAQKGKFVVGDLLDVTITDLRTMAGIGQKGVGDIVAFLEKRGYELPLYSPLRRI